jgi:subtilase family serine protease
VTIRKAPNTTNPPGDWTVVDLAQYYDISPLYAQGVHGDGTTVGIVTLASFTPSDAFVYWNGLGLPVKNNRLKIVDIDGGPGVPSDDSGSDETTLDVQQSGGVAPGAKIIVYQAPNTDQAFFDAFVRAVNDNKADTVSVSWGEWEWFDTQADVSVGKKGRTVDFLHALDSVLLQAAVQGQSFFAASGDDGAYDINDPSLTPTLSVDFPSSSPWMTSAGGTTLPGPQAFLLNDGSVYTLTIAHEQVWGWDYLIDLCAKLGFDPTSCGIYPIGGGGGVSSFEPLPFYQLLVPTRTTEPGQRLADTTTGEVFVVLPSHFHGRNVPDVSLNADPDTGYILPYTSDTDGFSVLEFFGGTSFVAPQLNGIAALLVQRLHGRIGLFNVPLYLVASTNAAYAGPDAPLRDIKAGDNWFYRGRPGYDQGSGVGTLDVANFARALQRLGF